MANLALQLRLGIRRGWRVKMFNDIGLYTPSLVHCMFIFTLLRVKALRLSVWVVGYYLVWASRRLTIHAFFWYVPALNAVEKLFGDTSSISARVTLAEDTISRYRHDLVGVSLIPTRAAWKGFIKSRRSLVKAGAQVSEFFQAWDMGGRMLFFLNFRNQYFYYDRAYSGALVNQSVGYPALTPRC